MIDNENELFVLNSAAWQGSSKIPGHERSIVLLVFSEPAIENKMTVNRLGSRITGIRKTSAFTCVTRLGKHAVSAIEHLTKSKVIEVEITRLTKQSQSDDFFESAFSYKFINSLFLSIEFEYRFRLPKRNEEIDNIVLVTFEICAAESLKTSKQIDQNNQVVGTFKTGQSSKTGQ